MNTVLNDKLTAINTYLDRGWHLIPLHYVTDDGACTCAKGLNCKSKGKHPTSSWQTCAGHVVSKTHAERVWTQDPHLNVGIATGKCSGVFVIDVDVDKDKPGLKSLEKLMQDSGQSLFDSLIHTTGSGGFHIFLSMPEEGDITNATSGFEDIYPGIDLRGTGGLVVAPPSESNKGPYDVYFDNEMDPAKPKLLEIVRTGRKPKLVEVAQAPEQAYDSLPAHVQAMCDAYANKALESELQRFKDEYDCNNWDKRSNEIAFNCFLISNATWNSLQNGFIAKDYSDYQIHSSGVVNALFEAGFRGGDNEWNDERLAKCILSAYESVVKIGKDPKPMPKKAQEELDKLNNPSRGEEFDWDNEIMGFEGLESYFTQDYLIEDYLPENVVARLFGASGSFKSFVTVDMAARISLGMDWYGHKVKKGKVLYIAAEGEQGMYKRAKAWNQENGVDMDVHFLPQRLQVAPGSAKWDSFIAYVAKSGYNLIVFDTQAKTTIGVNEDSATDFGKIVDAWDHLREQTKATVLIIHHTGWSNKERVRGSSASTAGINTELRIDRDDDTRYITITSPKQKDDDDQTNVRLLMNKVVVDGLFKKSGAPETSLVPTFPYTVRGSKILKNEVLDGKTAEFKRDVVELVAKMDTEEVPHTMGRDSVKELLPKWGIKASNERLAAAIKIRKEMQD